jgi:hypothetical protein
VKFKLLVGFAVAAGLASILPLPHALRLLVILPFLFVVPGLAFVWLCGLGDRFAELVVAIALSIALDVAVSMPLVLAGAWSAPAAIWVLGAITVIGVSIDPLNAEGGPPASRGRPRAIP